MEPQIPQPGQDMNVYQINPLQFSTYEFQDDRCYAYAYSEPRQGSCSFSEDCGTLNFKEEETASGAEEESEAVDELTQILVECLKRADIKTREVLLRKFFFEIEKEKQLEGFIVERIKQSKISLFDRMISSSSSREIRNNGEARKEHIREVDGPNEPGKKLDRFKVKNVQIGGVVKEQAK